MPPPHSALPGLLAPRHLYRHLLRESSYLPPAIRPNIVAIIHKRFRTHQNHDPLREKHVRRGNRSLRRLRSANSGDHRDMERLVRYGFARLGARRRALIIDFLQPQGPDDSDALEAHINSATNSNSPSKSSVTTKSATRSKQDRVSDEDADQAVSEALGVEPQQETKERRRRGPKSIEKFYDKWDIPKLKQLLESQRQRQEDTKINWPGRKIRTLNEFSTVPKTNILGFPPAPNIPKTKAARFWKLALKKLMVPLNKGEWDLLARLSQGAQGDDQWMVPERRPAAKPTQAVEQGSSSDWNWEPYVSTTAARIEPREWRSRAMSKGEVRRPYDIQRGHRNISPRWFRRTYQRVWNITPKMDEDPQSRERTFTWGSIKNRVVPASKSQLEFLEGLNRMNQKNNPNQS
ncbi:hypothetical protein FDECE_7547 [Fusarium decemcellulare]|nr:hypothetical protein FDECE_7547 [Fusarium decemcellulare]